ncbi:Dihydrofolate reductase [hydrothermal vent metagenome]|uniref:dihydrofolate reductase n=1 Tax=hydrothermal vent metagenome TaxID=652676 RepID=A0A3B1D0L3_9ZZZZ
MISFSLVAAMDLQRGIGKAGNLPWSFSGDMKYFKTLTTKTTTPQKQNIVMMGRKTWDSIPQKFRPLPNRINLVLTHKKNPDFPPPVLFADSLEKGLRLFQTSSYQEKIENIFIIGGEEIFEVALKMPACKKLYITHIQHTFDCDTFFPHFEQQFKQNTTSKTLQENGIPYYFAEYQRHTNANLP